MRNLRSWAARLARALRPAAPRVRRPAALLEAEALERREVPAAVTFRTLPGGALLVQGTNGADQVRLTQYDTRTDLLTFQHRTDGSAYQYASYRLSGISKILFRGEAGKDSFTYTVGNFAGVALPVMDLDGGAGDDVLYGGPRNDVLRGGPGKDELQGLAGVDILEGGADGDRLHGADGDDLLCGGTGNDTLYGNAGADWLFGGGESGDVYSDARADRVIRGLCAMSPLVGDWDGDGRDTVGGYIGSHSLFVLYDPARPYIPFGRSGDLPLVGDWDGDRRDDIGVYRTAGSSLVQNQYLLDLGAPGESGELAYSFGLRGDVPLVGDWDGDGRDDIGTYRVNGGAGPMYFLDEGPRGWTGATAGERGYQFGLPGDVPIVGDWNGDGRDDFGVFRRNDPRGPSYFLDEGARGWTGATAGERGYQFGLAGDVPLVGDWNGDGKDDFGTYRPSQGRFYLDEGERGWTGRYPGELGYAVGAPGGVPVVGDWNGDGRDDFGIFLSAF